MKNRLYLVGGVLLVAALGWAAWQTVRALPERGQEAGYEGRPLNYWLTNPAPPPPSLVRDSNAVPFLIRALRRDSSTAAAIYRKQVWPKLPPAIQNHLSPPVGKPEVRRQAAFLLFQMGPVAKPATQALVRALKEDDALGVRWAAALALGKAGEGDSNVGAALAGALKDKNADVRWSAARSLGLIGQGGQATVVALQQASKDKATRVQIEAAHALWRIHPEAAVEALSKDTDSDVRQRAAEALGDSAKGNAAVVAALTDALNDRGLLVRKAATNALLKIDPEAAAKVGVK